MKKFEGNAMIGMVADKLKIEGPIKTDTSSYMVSFRRLLYDLITRPLTKIVFDGTSVGYSFYDFNAKVNYRLSDNDRVLVSVYMGNDRSVIRRKKGDSFKNSLQWGNHLAALRWNHVYGQKLFSNATLAYTRYRYLAEDSSTFKSEGAVNETFVSFKSGIYDASAKLDFDYFAGPNYNLRFGLNSIYHTFVPGINKMEEQTNGDVIFDTVDGDYRINAWENSVYIENDIKISKKLSSNIGLRLSAYHVNSENFVSLEPRLLVNYLLTDKLSIKASYAAMQQNVHLLTSSGIDFPIDLWLPATDKAVPGKSQQLAFGIAKSLKQGRYEFSIEAYYKKMRNLIEYKNGASYSGSATDWEDKVETNGIGEAYGLEVLLQKKEGRTTGWIGYTLSKTDRQFSNINNGKKFPYRYDRRHDASIVVNHKLTDNIDFSATWVYGTGNAFTLATAKYKTIGDVYFGFGDAENPGEKLTEIEIYEGRNNYRMRSFHKLDIGFNFRKKKKKGMRTWNISIYNLYNRQNPFFYFFDSDSTYDNQGNEISGKTVLKQQSLFPILPSICYSFKF